MWGVSVIRADNKVKKDELSLNCKLRKNAIFCGIILTISGTIYYLYDK